MGHYELKGGASKKHNFLMKVFQKVPKNSFCGLSSDGDDRKVVPLLRHSELYQELNYQLQLFFFLFFVQPDMGELEC